MKTTSHIEIMRAVQLIEKGLAEIDAEDGCVHGFASAMLVNAATLYSFAHGYTGPDGSMATLQKLADIHATREAMAKAKANHSQAGQA